MVMGLSNNLSRAAVFAGLAACGGDGCGNGGIDEVDSASTPVTIVNLTEPVTIDPVACLQAWKDGLLSEDELGDDSDDERIFMSPTESRPEEITNTAIFDTPNVDHLQAQLDLSTLPTALPTDPAELIEDGRLHCVSIPGLNPNAVAPTEAGPLWVYDKEPQSAGSSDEFVPHVSGRHLYVTGRSEDVRFDDNGEAAIVCFTNELGDGCQELVVTAETFNTVGMFKDTDGDVSFVTRPLPTTDTVDTAGATGITSPTTTVPTGDTAADTGDTGL